MPDNYQLTELAREDLRAIARYTVSQWGIGQVQRYQSEVETCFREIADRTIQGRKFVNRRSDLLFDRLAHHFILRAP